MDVGIEAASWPCSRRNRDLRRGDISRVFRQKGFVSNPTSKSCTTSAMASSCETIQAKICMLQKPLPFRGLSAFSRADRLCNVLYLIADVEMTRCVGCKPSNHRIGHDTRASTMPHSFAVPAPRIHAILFSSNHSPFSNQRASSQPASSASSRGSASIGNRRTWTSKR